MIRLFKLFAGMMGLVFIFNQMAVAATNYVDKYGVNPVPNFTNW